MQFDSWWSVLAKTVFCVFANWVSRILYLIAYREESWRKNMLERHDWHDLDAWDFYTPVWLFSVCFPITPCCAQLCLNITTKIKSILHPCLKLKYNISCRGSSKWLRLLCHCTMIIAQPAVHYLIASEIEINVCSWAGNLGRANKWNTVPIK